MGLVSLHITRQKLWRVLNGNVVGFFCNIILIHCDAKTEHLLLHGIRVIVLECLQRRLILIPLGIKLVSLLGSELLRKHFIDQLRGVLSVNLSNTRLINQAHLVRVCLRAVSSEIHLIH